MAAEKELAEAAAPHAAEGAAHPPELPNIIHLLHEAFEDNAIINFLYVWNYQVYMLIGMVFIFFFFTRAAKSFSLIPGRLQAFLEMIVMGLFDIVAGILGEKEARRYFPLIGSLFIFIFTMNWMGLVPLLRAPTSNICVTAGLAICVFLFCQYTALVRLGPGKYFYHLLGEPKDPIGWCLTPLFLPLHIMEEFIKPLSLAARLFGNILGEDILLGVMMTLGLGIVGALMLASGFEGDPWIGIPLHLPFMFVAMLLGTVQALVFTMLTTLYISTVVPHDDHH